MAKQKDFLMEAFFSVFILGANDGDRIFCGRSATFFCDKTKNGDRHFLLSFGQALHSRPSKENINCHWQFMTTRP
jgi:hypothetical protein